MTDHCLDRVKHVYSSAYFTCPDSINLSDKLTDKLIEFTTQIEIATKVYLERHSFLKLYLNENSIQYVVVFTTLMVLFLILVINWWKKKRKIYLTEKSFLDQNKIMQVNCWFCNRNQQVPKYKSVEGFNCQYDDCGQYNGFKGNFEIYIIVVANFWKQAWKLLVSSHDRHMK